MDDLIRCNRALLVEVAAARALHRRIARGRRAPPSRAETIGRQQHVQPVDLT
jgi:hypothetical protein